VNHSTEEINIMEKMLTVKEVQEIMRLSRAKTYELVNRTDFPKIRIGRCIRVSETALKQYLEHKNMADPIS